ncbi:MAG TPA: glycosyltransferase family 4 protein [Roseiflexaceae bacterium]|nr:glycosyltransferase family 4 protein [Roseiflexaceae bacterium]
MKILFLSAWCPLPADNGSKLRIAQLLRGLAARHRVDLLSFAPQPPDQASLETMRALCGEVELLLETPFADRPVGRLAGLLSPRPRSVVANHSPAMEAAVRRRAGHSYDLVIASQLHMAPYALLLPDTPRVLEEVELAIIREQFADAPSARARLRYGLTWWKTRSYVAGLLRSFGGATVVSERERELLRPLAPAGLPLAVVPNGVDVAACAGDYGPPEPDVLIYPGAVSYHANRQAVAFFAAEVLPHIRAKRPAARLRVTGRASPQEIATLPADPGLEFTGYLEDVRPAVARAWAEVVPLRTGGGTRLKVLEALALGTPLVSTSKGVEGLDLLAGREVLLADTPADFAAQTLRLLADPSLRTELSTQGRLAATRYDWSHSVTALEELVERVGANKR